MLNGHAFYIVTSFTVFALAIAGLIAWVTIDHRVQRRTLEALEARGVRRRSARKGGDAA